MLLLHHYTPQKSLVAFNAAFHCIVSSSRFCTLPLAPPLAPRRPNHGFTPGYSAHQWRTVIDQSYPELQNERARWSLWEIAPQGKSPYNRRRHLSPPRYCHAQRNSDPARLVGEAKHDDGTRKRLWENAEGVIPR